MTDFDADGSTRSDRTVDVTSTGGAGLTGTEGRLSDRGEEVIPVVEERLRVGKRDVSHGRVRIRSYVVETPVEEQVTLREERVAVERRPVDRALGDAEQAFQERTIEAEERREEAVVSKEARVKEELVVRKEAEQRTETVSDTVRRPRSRSRTSAATRSAAQAPRTGPEPLSAEGPAARSGSCSRCRGHSFRCGFGYDTVPRHGL